MSRPAQQPPEQIAALVKYTARSRERGNVESEALRHVGMRTENACTLLESRRGMSESCLRARAGRERAMWRVCARGLCWHGPRTAHERACGVSTCIDDRCRVWLAALSLSLPASRNISVGL